MELHPTVVALLEDSHSVREMMKPRYLPMVVPPLPWCKERERLFDSGSAHGGYLKLQSQFMCVKFIYLNNNLLKIFIFKIEYTLANMLNTRRTRGSFMQPDVLRRANLDKVFESLNFLGSVPWKINTSILEVVEQVWAQGGGIAEIPRIQNHVLPPEPTQRTNQSDEEYVDFYIFYIF